MAVAASAVLALWPASGLAHDASSWGGLFRSRDGGATWFQASVGKVMGSALAVAVDPNDPTRLLLGTDSGLLESRNGGLDWNLIAQDVLVGAVLAVAFDGSGQQLVAASGSTLATSDDGVRWRQAALPVGAAPARSLVSGIAPGTFYLVGWRSLLKTVDGGVTWFTLDTALPDHTVTRLIVDPHAAERLMVVDGGNIYLTRNGGQGWEAPSAGLPAGQIEVAAFDPALPDGLWAAGANQVFASDDAGATWHRVGQPLPEAGTEIRGIAVDARDHAHIVLSSQRGLYASRDAAHSWDLLGDNLPGHIDAGPLVRERGESATLYAVFSVTPYDEAWRNAAAGGSPLSRLAANEAVGGAAFILMVGLTAGLALRWLAQRSQPALTSATAQLRSIRPRPW